MFIRLSQYQFASGTAENVRFSTNELTLYGASFGDGTLSSHCGIPNGFTFQSASFGTAAYYIGSSNHPLLDMCSINNPTILSFAAPTAPYIEQYGFQTYSANQSCTVYSLLACSPDQYLANYTSLIGSNADNLIVGTNYQGLQPNTDTFQCNNQSHVGLSAHPPASLKCVLNVANIGDQIALLIGTTQPEGTITIADTMNLSFSVSTSGCQSTVSQGCEALYVASAVSTGSDTITVTIQNTGGDYGDWMYNAFDFTSAPIHAVLNAGSSSTTYCTTSSAFSFTYLDPYALTAGACYPTEGNVWSATDSNWNLTSHSNSGGAIEYTLNSSLFATANPMTWHFPKAGGPTKYAYIVLNAELPSTYFSAHPPTTQNGLSFTYLESMGGITLWYAPITSGEALLGFDSVAFNSTFDGTAFFWIEVIGLQADSVAIESAIGFGTPAVGTNLTAELPTQTFSVAMNYMNAFDGQGVANGSLYYLSHELQPDTTPLWVNEGFPSASQVPNFNMQASFAGAASGNSLLPMNYTDVSDGSWFEIAASFGPSSCPASTGTTTSLDSSNIYTSSAFSTSTTSTTSVSTDGSNGGGYGGTITTTEYEFHNTTYTITSDTTFQTTTQAYVTIRTTLSCTVTTPFTVTSTVTATNATTTTLTTSTFSGSNFLGFPDYLPIFIFMLLVALMLAIVYKWMRRHGPDHYGSGIET